MRRPSSMRARPVLAYSSYGEFRILATSGGRRAATRTSRRCRSGCWNSSSGDVGGSFDPLVAGAALVDVVSDLQEAGTFSLSWTMCSGPAGLTDFGASVQGGAPPSSYVDVVVNAVGGRPPAHHRTGLVTSS
ncbi:hypothetical protein ACGFNU_33860 [Spirillospora sp. NPDC048911]|uniref:hypothetical protein n=1 Tax=Spirillospora sp. NPDC048911 TaxID=3364527 RepID=UPI0037225258